MLEKILKLTLDYVALEVLTAGSTLLSRYAFPDAVASFFGGHYERSIYEHFCNGIILPLIASHYNTVIENTFGREYRQDVICYGISAGCYMGALLIWEIGQAQKRGYFQPEQVLGDLAGVTTAIIFSEIYSRVRRRFV